MAPYTTDDKGTAEFSKPLQLTNKVGINAWNITQLVPYKTPRIQVQAECSYTPCKAPTKELLFMHTNTCVAGEKQRCMIPYLHQENITIF
jgi:hypothetical protein